MKLLQTHQKESPRENQKPLRTRSDPHEPYYVLEPTSEGREIFLRTMYLLFLLLFIATYSLTLNATLCLILYTLLPEQGFPLPSEILALTGILLALSEPTLTFWKKKLALERIDAQFNGATYTWAHQTHPLWPQLKPLIDKYQKSSGESLPQLRALLAAYAHTHRELYGVIHSIADGPLQHALTTWTPSKNAANPS